MRKKVVEKVYKKGQCLRCCKRPADMGLVCKFCHSYLQQVARGASSKPPKVTLEELEAIRRELELAWPNT